MAGTQTFWGAGQSATGSSLETMASQCNSQVQIDTEYHDYTHLATTSETKTDTRTTTGTGLVGTRNWVVDADHTTTKTSWINGNSDTTTANGSYSDTGTSTFALDAPRLTNLHPKPMIAVADLAVGKNLEGQGLLQGVNENLAQVVGTVGGTTTSISSKTSTDDYFAGNQNQSGDGTKQAGTGGGVGVRICLLAQMRDFCYLPVDVAA